MLNYTTEYLILHENKLDWDKISSDSEDDFSLIEIRLFRSKINWKKYFNSHIKNIVMTTEMFELASKYFDDCVYKIISCFDVAPEEFILNHADRFDFSLLIENYKLSEEFLLNTVDFWNEDKTRLAFRRAKFIDLESPQYASIKLLLEAQ